MKKATLILSIALGILTLNLFSQNVELTFAGDNNGLPVQLDSVIVKNITQGCEVTLYPPDFTLVLIITGIEDGKTQKSNIFSLYQNYPNPFAYNTSIQLQVPVKAKVEILISNILGQNLLSFNEILSAGMHTFSFTPGKDPFYFLTANFMGQTKTIKMQCNPHKAMPAISLNHSGQSDLYTVFKSSEIMSELPYELGDELLMIAYSESTESGMVKSPEVSQEYIIQFATNIPCIGNPTVDYEGQTYNTIQIFSQCWLKENLNVGVMIHSSQSQTNNDTIEKYCMSDNEYYCDNFAGGLYFWNEMMKYTNETGGQGICPDGWHIPDDLDWQILEGAVDSDYKIGNQEWENYNWRGADAGGNLKQTGTTSWEPPNNGATDAFGFSALPGGYFVQGGFWGPGHKGYFWSSDYTKKYYRNLDWNQIKVNRKSGGNGLAISVRCIKNK